MRFRSPTIPEIVDKSGTSCYYLVTRLMRSTDSQQVVPISLISYASNKLLTSWWQQGEQARSNLLPNRAVLVLLEQLVETTLYYRHQPCNKVITTCSRLITTTGNTQCEYIVISTSTLLQLACRLVTTCAFLRVYLRQKKNMWVSGFFL
jgi:hypothetical protein